jgi:mannose/fructose/N-acetylgalactosamine-specific phosphotransferase system component IID
MVSEVNNLLGLSTLDLLVPSSINIQLHFKLEKSSLTQFTNDQNTLNYLAF